MSVWIRLYGIRAISGICQVSTINGKYCVEFPSFLAVPPELAAQATEVEVSTELPSNSYRLGIHRNDADDPTNVVEIIATGRHLQVSGRHYEMVKMAFHAFLTGLGDDLAQQFRRNGLE